jgi:hypothetical protein
MSQLKNYSRLVMRAAPLLNTPGAAMATSRRFGRMVSRRNIAIITYTGRRSGRSFSIPVAYRRDGDDLEIAANMPDAKSWWRNFLGDGAPLTVRLDGFERPGHDEHVHVTVRVRLGAS